MILVDTNVLLDVLTGDPEWSEWSIIALRDHAASPLAINEIVYAEMAGHTPSEKELDSAISLLNLNLERIPKSALYLAGQVFYRYRRMGGVRTGVLPDFFIGAHAQIAGLPILTRDLRRYRTYFPKVKLISP